jgi:hypothetical protein
MDNDSALTAQAHEGKQQRKFLSLLKSGKSDQLDI